MWLETFSQKQKEYNRNVELNPTMEHYTNITGWLLQPVDAVKQHFLQ